MEIRFTGARASRCSADAKLVAGPRPGRPPRPQRRGRGLTASQGRRCPPRDPPTRGASRRAVVVGVHVRLGVAHQSLGLLTRRFDVGSVDCVRLPAPAVAVVGQPDGAAAREDGGAPGRHLVERAGSPPLMSTAPALTLPSAPARVSRASVRRRRRGGAGPPRSAGAPRTLRRPRPARTRRRASRPTPGRPAREVVSKASTPMVRFNGVAEVEIDPARGG